MAFTLPDLPYPLLEVDEEGRWRRQAARQTREADHLRCRSGHKSQRRLDPGWRHQFGSGWCWLAVKGGKIVIMKTPNGKNPLVHGTEPILGCDVWEHSYHIDYRNRRLGDSRPQGGKVFDKDESTITGGNAPGLNSGASAMIVAERGWAEKQGLKSMARLVSYGIGAVEPGISSSGPFPLYIRRSRAPAGRSPTFTASSVVRCLGRRRCKALRQQRGSRKLAWSER